MEGLPPADETPLINTPEPENLTSAVIILTLLDGVVTMAIGSRYAMTREERKTIAEPLERIMQRFPAAQIAQYGQFVDPVLVIMGLVAWGSRISRMKREETETGNRSEPKPEPRKPEPKPETRKPIPQEPEASLSEQMAAPENIRVNLGSVTD